MANQVESVVIVTNRYGSIATMRFSDPKTDRIISSSNKPILYTQIEKYVKKVTR